MQEVWNFDLDVPENYLNWSKEVLGIDYKSDEIKRHYEFMRQTLDSLNQCDIIIDLRRYIVDCDREYDSERGVPLLMLDEYGKRQDIMLENIYRIKIKPYKSIVNKSYRLNKRKGFEGASDEYCTPKTWFTQITDICRGTIVCKYMDGPEFISKKIEEFFNVRGVQIASRSVAYDRGYYAFHVLFTIRTLVHVYGEGLQEVDIPFEIQVTTQLQEAIYALTHPFYERTRTGDQDNDQSWKWNSKSEKFKPAFVGHTLHLLESLIMEIRDSEYFRSRDERAELNQTDDVPSVENRESA